MLKGFPMATGRLPAAIADRPMRSKVCPVSLFGVLILAACASGVPRSTLPGKIADVTLPAPRYVPGSGPICVDGCGSPPVEPNTGDSYIPRRFRGEVGPISVLPP